MKQAPKEQKLVFETVLLLKKCAVRKARNNTSFLAVELGDKTGLFHIVCFENSPNYELFSSLAEGSVLRVKGQTDYYQNRFSPTLDTVSLVPEGEQAELVDNLVASAPIPREELWAELQDHIQFIPHEGLRSAVRSAIEELGEAFQRAPGAISMHHAYRSGLMEHTVRMARAGRALLPLYPEVDPSLAVAGILLHDIGKVLEYTGSLAPAKSRAGLLQGHVVIGYRLARKAGLQNRLDADLLERLEHIILSHQGELEWGAAVKAATPEAVFVSMVDNLDAKMGMVQAALRDTPEGAEFSEFVAGLGAPILCQKPIDGGQS
ncbi:MAG: HD domain-containing protein [Verrucomicrobia bacterium]|nr:HD domain-containing protein [Verrucomicrobiota bacterium]